MASCIVVRLGLRDREFEILIRSSRRQFIPAVLRNILSGE